VATHIPSDPGVLFDTDQANTGRPVYGRTYTALANTINGLHGAWFLRYTAACIEIPPYNGTANPHFDSPDTAFATALDPTTRITFRMSAAARYLWIGAHLTAGDFATGSAPEFTAHLMDMSASSIDGPIYWSKANGLLPLTHQRPRSVFPDANYVADTMGASRRDDRFISSGGRLGVDSRPRMLDGDGYQGKDVQVAFTWARVRPYAVMVMEAHRGSI